MKLLCRLGWHSWGRWSSFWYQGFYDKRKVERYNEQRSLCCEHCGLIIHKTFRRYLILEGNDWAWSPTWKDK